MKSAHKPDALQTPPRVVAAIAWRSILPLDPSSFTVARMVYAVLSLVS